MMQSAPETRGAVLLCKFQFIVLMFDDIVGANCVRPAVQYFEFAADQCKYATFLCAGERSSPLHPLS